MSRRMLGLAWSTVRERKGGFIAAFVAVMFGSAVITACGILLDSSVRSGVPADRYRAADLVVTAPRALDVPEDVDPGFAERATLPAGRVADVARIPGVREAIPDVRVALSVVTPDGGVLPGPVSGHGWQSVALGDPAAAGPLETGRAPGGADEVVLDAALAERAGVGAGDPVRLAMGSQAATYLVIGIVDRPGARGSAALFTDERARELSGRPDRVGAIGVLAEPGADTGELAAAVEAAFPDVVVHTGEDRSAAEFDDVGRTRSFLGEVALAFGSAMFLVIMVVVGSTLGLSVRQRLRELAMLRAIGATPQQVLRMIAAETTLVGTLGAVLGVLPGVGLSLLLREGFVLAGAVPADFGWSFGPWPPLVAVVSCLVAARLGGWIAARRAARLRPVDALGESAVEPPRLGPVRVAAGLLLLPAGLAAAIVPPLRLDGEGAAESAAFSAFLLLFAVGLLGPRLLGGAVTVLGPWLNRRSGVSGFLATAGARAHSRRLAAATTPLIMGITLAAGQLFSATTAESAARDQAADGLRADQIVTATPAGLSPEIADLVRAVPGVTAATPVVRTRTLAVFGDQIRDYAAQGVAFDPLGGAMDLGVFAGDMADLRGGTVALSRIAAATLGAGLGDTVDLRLGDGTPITPTVVALYERGLGFGDVTLPHDVVLEHTTDRLDFAVLVAGTGDVAAALRHLPAVEVSDREAFVAAQREASAGTSLVGLMLNGVLLVYLAIAVVNTLVTATVARAPEFAVLRLAGATDRQVRAMMRAETRIIVVTAVLLGALTALPSLVGTALALNGTPVPTVPPLRLLGIVAVTALLGRAAVMTSTRLALRAVSAG